MREVAVIIDNVGRLENKRHRVNTVCRRSFILTHSPQQGDRPPIARPKLLPIKRSDMMRDANRRRIVTIMTDGYQSARILGHPIPGPDSRHRRTSSQSLLLHGPPFDHDVVESQSPVRMSLDSGFLGCEPVPTHSESSV